MRRTRIVIELETDADPKAVSDRFHWLVNDYILKDCRGTEYQDGQVGEVKLTIQDPIAKRELPQAMMHEILERVYKFPHNVNLGTLLEAVYGPWTLEAQSYMQSKLDLIGRKGFTWWYCDLDLTNQDKVIKTMLERYPELEDLLS